MHILLQMIQPAPPEVGAGLGGAHAPTTSSEFASLLAALEQSLAQPAENADQVDAPPAPTETEMLTDLAAQPAMALQLLAAMPAEQAMPLEGPAGEAVVQQAAPDTTMVTAPEPEAVAKPLHPAPPVALSEASMPAPVEEPVAAADTFVGMKPEPQPSGIAPEAAVQAAPSGAKAVLPREAAVLHPQTAEAAVGPVEIGLPTDPDSVPFPPARIATPPDPALATAQRPESRVSYQVSPNPARVEAEAVATAMRPEHLTPAMTMAAESGAVEVADEDLEPEGAKAQAKPDHVLADSEPAEDLLEALPAQHHRLRPPDSEPAAATPPRALAAGWKAEQVLPPPDHAAPPATQAGSSTVTPEAAPMPAAVSAPVIERSAAPPAMGVPPQSGVTLPHLGDQVVKSVRYLASGEEGSMKVRLIPESLGELHLEVKHGREGVTVTMASAHATVRDALETHAHVLQESLARDGIEVQRIEVTSAPANQGQHSLPQRGPGEHQRGPWQEAPRPQFAWRPEASPAYAPTGRAESALRGHGGSLNLFV